MPSARCILRTVGHANGRAFCRDWHDITGVEYDALWDIVDVDPALQKWGDKSDFYALGPDGSEMWGKAWDTYTEHPRVEDWNEDLKRVVYRHAA